MTRLDVEETRLVSALEAAHAGDGGLQVWLDELVAGVRALLPTLDLAVGAVVQRRANHWSLLAGDSLSKRIEPIALFGEQMAQVDPNALDPYYRYHERVYTHGRARQQYPATREVGDAFLAAVGMNDSLSLLCNGGDGTAMTVFAMAPSTIEVSPRARLRLSRLAAHVEAALRLRVDHGALVAVLGSSGKVLHAEKDGRSGAVRASLQRHVAAVEKTRLRAMRSNPDAIDGWSALVSGRFGIVEQHDQGKREYWAFEHPRHVWSTRALTNREANVLELSARGLAGKLVAYSLGISETTVSLDLASAAFKAGCSSRSDVVRLAAIVLQPSTSATDDSSLTRAEREVLAGLRAGWSNGAIARERGTSERTVANQVGSILRKLGKSSRRAVAAGPD